MIEPLARRYRCTSVLYVGSISQTWPNHKIAVFSGLAFALSQFGISSAFVSEQRPPPHTLSSSCNSSSSIGMDDHGTLPSLGLNNRGRMGESFRKTAAQPSRFKSHRTTTSMNRSRRARDKRGCVIKITAPTDRLALHVLTGGGEWSPRNEGQLR